MTHNELIPHLFRTEFRKITTVLCKLFGIEHIEVAEDIASETFLSALGEIILYNDQDETLWNDELIAKGAYFLHQSSTGNHISKYHVEAGIAYWYTIKNDTKEKWEKILQLFNQLLQIEYSAIAALNRTYALSKANGKAQAIIEAEKLNLVNNHFCFTLLGELYKGIDNNKAEEILKKLTISPGHRQINKL